MLTFLGWLGLVLLAPFFGTTIVALAALVAIKAEYGLWCIVTLPAILIAWLYDRKNLPARGEDAANFLTDAINYATMIFFPSSNREDGEEVDGDEGADEYSSQPTVLIGNPIACAGSQEPHRRGGKNTPDDSDLPMVDEDEVHRSPPVSGLS